MSFVSRFFERAQLRQFAVGLVALPMSAVPFAAYGTFTPEGRLVRDRLRVAVSPPVLPRLTVAQEKAARDLAPRYSGQVMALVYHGVGSGGDSDGDGGFSLSPKRFGEHLATLRAAGMHPVTAGDVARAFGAGKPLPDRAVMISFDDGRTDALLWADPLLDQAGMKATMFVISSAAAEPGIYYAGWGRLREAARSGRWDIQAHTHDAHRDQKTAGGRKLPVLTSLAPGESIDEYRRRVSDDLEENSAAILAHVGRRPVALAYPFGAYGAERANDERIREVLREEVARRFALAFHQDGQDTVPLVDTTQDRVSLRRLEVGNWSGAALLDHINRAASPVVDPERVAPPTAEELPAIPFLPELRGDPAPIPPESSFPAPAAQPSPSPAAPPAGAPTPETTTSTPPSPPPPPAVAPVPTTTSPPPPTAVTTGPAPTTTTTGPRTTITTKPPAPTTTTTTRPTTSTTRCRKANGKPCRK
ncbi:MAG TPA: polysaccharide deacetylase family protein [Acidimicrobiia bacterium]|nr:polysaccharide deacetylase family protein [Acidimicrobiia bacterium]